MRILITALTLLAAGAASAQPQSKLSVKDLAPAVQKTVRETLKGGELKNISKETDAGVSQYEIESVLNGKRRDFNVDAKGTLLVVEEETSLDSVPAAVKSAIQKKVGDGKLGLVETFTKPGKAMMYEAAWKTKAGKSQEVLLNADGTPGKA